MPLIRFIALNPEEAAAINAAAAFWPSTKGFQFELVAGSWDQPPFAYNITDTLILKSIADVAKLPDAPEIINVFGSIASFQIWNRYQTQPSPTLCIYNHLAIMELHGISPSPTLLQQMGYELCILLEENDIASIYPELTFKTYHDITHLYKDKDDNRVLLTANHQLLLGLIGLDSHHWTIIHPDHAALNLNLDTCQDPALKLAREMQIIQALFSSGSPPATSWLDIRGIRSKMTSNKSSYSFFANHYDQYMAHVDYDLWINRILRWYRMHSSRPLRKILELACGTANVSCKLVAQGYHVDASDLSPGMLNVASGKPFKPNLYLASLTDPIPGNGYDFIICMFDSINYLLKTSEISALLDNAHAALAEHGILIFDISTRLNSEENFDDICSLTRYEDCIMVHRAWFEPLQMLQKSSLRYFHQESVGYSQQHEIHVQRVYLCSELVKVIKHSQLHLKAIYSIDSDHNLYPRQVQSADDRYHRLFFVLGKDS